jgi:hypothetical protein
MIDTKPTLEDAFAVMVALARTVTSIGDASLSQLTAHISARVARLTLDSEPDEVRAVLDMADALDAALGRLSRAIDAEAVDA